VSIPRDSTAAILTIKLFNHNAFAWDTPLGQVVIDLKDFATKNLPKKDLSMDLKPQEDTLDKVNPTGSLKLELINSESQEVAGRPVTKKLDNLMTVFDEDFMSLDHKFNLSALVHNFKEKTGDKIPLESAHLQ